MSRTEGQVAADDALTAAIVGVQQAYGHRDGEPTVLASYLVLTASQGWDDDGYPFTSYSTISMDENGVSLHEVIGLLRRALVVAERAALPDDH